MLQGLFLSLLLGVAVFLLLSNSVTFNFAWSPFPALFFSTALTSSLFLKILTVIVLSIILILCQLFFRKHDFFDTPSYYPAVFFLSILLSSGIAANSLFSLFFLFILTLILLVNVDYTLPVVKGRIFISGILIGILSFFNLAAPLLLFFLIGSLMTHRFARLKDVCVIFFGFLLPLIYFFSYYFFTNQLENAAGVFSQLSFFGFTKVLFTLSSFQIIKLILLIIILFYFLIWLHSQYTSKLIVMRRRLNSVSVMTFILLCMLFFSNSSYEELQLYLILPFTVHFSLAIREQRRWIFHDILIISTLVLLWL